MDGNTTLDECQANVGQWVERVFGKRLLSNLHERVARMLEEALELAQSDGLSEEEAQVMLRHVYSRPKGDPGQEAAGAGITLLAYAAGKQVSLGDLMGQEMARIAHVTPEKAAKRNEEKRRAGIVAYPVEGGG